MFHQKSLSGYVARLNVMHFDPEKCSDERLFGLVQEQDSQTAFAELYNRYWESLFEQAFQRLKSVDTAEELVQEIFVQLYARRKQVRLTSSVSNYLKTALKYKVFDIYRAREAHRKFLEQAIVPVIDYEHPYEKLKDKELVRQVETAITLMPSKCREVFYMSRYEYLPQQVIAARLGITLSTVKKHLTKALRILRTELCSYRQDALFLFFCLTIGLSYPCLLFF